jgi:hypothetical protein
LTLLLEHAGVTGVAIVFAMLLVEDLDIFVWQDIARRKFGQATPRTRVGSSAIRGALPGLIFSV